jgi:hypothetical protein
LVAGQDGRLAHAGAAALLRNVKAPGMYRYQGDIDRSGARVIMVARGL